MGILRSLGRGSYNLFVGTLIAVLVAGGVALATNYTMTQGIGLTFGSVVVGGTNYAQQLLCDLTAPATQCAAVSAAGAVKVDGSAVTQPVSGSVSLTGATNNINNITGTVSLPTGAATSALQPTNAGQASTTSGQTGHLVMGAATTGAPTYVTGQTDPISLDLAGNVRVNCATGCAAGTTSNAGSGVATSSTNSATVAYNYGFNGATWDQLQVDASKNLKVTVANASTDPCTNTKTNFAIATTATTLQMVAPSGSTQIYVCSLSLIVGGATAVNVIGGTGATCTTGTPVAAIGTTTPTTLGMSLPANGGLTFGGGLGTVTRTTTAGHGLCLVQSGSAQLSGNITYVQQ